MGMHGIERYRERFREIVRGKIKQDLKKYMSQDGIDVFGKEGRHKITVPIPHISLPKFIYGKKGGGVGEGKPEKAGDEKSDNSLEVEVTLEEMASLLSEELELPRIEPKGKSTILVDSKKYRSIRKVGPESLRHFRRTYLEALKRAIMLDEYDPDDSSVVPIKEDRRYRAAKPITLPQNQAVIFYMMDVSGSMGTQEKELARLTSFWIDLWLRHQYKDRLATRYIIHNVDAKETDRHTFYHTMEGGGTRIASAYELVAAMIKKEYNPQDWNIYIFQYSDGDDWAGASSAACNIISDLLPSVNQISYCQVREQGEFKGALEKRFANESKVVITTAFQKEQILGAIKEFFKKGN